MVRKLTNYLEKMEELKGKIQEAAKKDQELVVSMEVDSVEDLGKLSEEEVFLWIRQLGITPDSEEHKQLVGIIGEIRDKKDKE